MSWSDNQIVFDDGMSSFGSFSMALVDFTASPPEAVTHYIDIPGRVDGYLDLTEAMTGYTVYNSRDMTFVCLVMMDADDHETFKTQLYNYLHGKKKTFSLSFDEDYTYTGRFEVVSVDSSHRNMMLVTLKAKCKPWKHKETKTYMLNATGGMTYKFISGERPVSPTVECTEPLVIRWESEEINVGAGTWRLNNVIFTSGINEISFNTVSMYSVFWDDVKSGGTFAMTWNTAAEKRWNEHAKKALEDEAGMAAQCWNDLRSKYTWKSIADAKAAWQDLNFTTSTGSSPVYLQYEWEDL
jgi:hypothetical protein